MTNAYVTVRRSTTCGGKYGDRLIFEQYHGKNRFPGNKVEKGQELGYFQFGGSTYGAFLPGLQKLIPPLFI